MLVLAFIASNKSYSLLTCTSEDGVNWEGNFDVGEAGYELAMTTLHGELILGFRASDDTHLLLTAKSKDGVHWDGNFDVDQESKVSLSLTVFEDQAFLAFVSNDGQDRILTCTSADGERWSDNRIVDGQYTSYAPGVTEFHRRLRLGFREAGLERIPRPLDVCDSPDGIIWSHNVLVGPNIEGQPAMASFQGHVYAAFNAPYMDINGESHVALVVWRSNDDGSWFRAIHFEDYTTTNTAFVVDERQRKLYLAYTQKGSGGNDPVVIRSFDGANWSNPTPVLGQTSYGVALGVI